MNLNFLTKDIAITHVDINYDQIINILNQNEKKFEKVFYISGNHEYYQNKKNPKSMKQIEDIIREICDNYDNLFYLQNEYYDLENIRIVGSTLWSEINEKET